MKTMNVNGRVVEYDQAGQGQHLLLLHTLLADASVYDTILPRLSAQRTVTRLVFRASAPRKAAAKVSRPMPTGRRTR